MRGTVACILIIMLLGATSVQGQTPGAGGPQFPSSPGTLPDGGAQQPISRLPATGDLPAPYVPPPYASPQYTSPQYGAPSTPASPSDSPYGNLQAPDANPYASTATPASSVAPSDQGLLNGRLKGGQGMVWSIGADAMGLFRTLGGSTPLGQTSLGGTGTTIDSLSTKGANFGIQPGVKLALGLRVDETYSYELLYFGMQNWSGSQSIQSDPVAGTLATSPYTQSDKLIGGFDQGLGYSYKSQLQNAEFNARRLFTGGGWTASPLAGFRFFQWSETLSLSGTDQFYGLTENLNSHTNNYLVGGQIGGDVRRDWDRFSLGITGKAGIFANFIQQNQSNLNSTGVAGLPGTGFVSINSDNRSTGLSGVFDLSAVATYHVTDHFAVRGGYQLLYVTGLALAPAQLAGPSHNGGVLLQGPTAGMEFSW